jgi:hypothetical protein
VRLFERDATGHKFQTSTNIRQQQIGNFRGQLIERLTDNAALHVRRHRARLLVERDDARRAH